MRAPWWQWPNILSLDAPVIALVWQEAFARSFAAPVSLPERLLLVLAVWCVYAADHVADGFRLGAPPGAAPRHRFAHRHCRTLIAAILVAGTTAAALVPGRERDLVAGGAALAAVVAAYFLWNHLAGERFARRWAKESVVGCVFAAGCLFVPFLRAPSAWGAAAGMVLGLVCSANCLLIARLDRESDIRRGETSLAVRLPPRTRPARILAGIALLGALPFFPLWPPLALSLVLAAVGLWAGVWVENRCGAAAAAVWADAVLLLPAIVFPVAAWFPA